MPAMPWRQAWLSALHPLQEIFEGIDRDYSGAITAPNLRLFMSRVCLNICNP